MPGLEGMEDRVCLFFAAFSDDQPGCLATEAILFEQLAQQDGAISISASISSLPALTLADQPIEAELSGGFKDDQPLVWIIDAQQQHSLQGGPAGAAVTADQYVGPS